VHLDCRGARQTCDCGLMSDAATTISCPRCSKSLRAPLNRNALGIICPICHFKWDWNPSSPNEVCLDYYEILQVSPNADLEVIDAAYRRLARKFHPNTCADPLAGRMMALLNEAAGVLSDGHRRRSYDAKRREQNSTRQQSHEKRSETAGAATKASSEPPSHKTTTTKPRSKAGFDPVDAYYVSPEGTQLFGPYTRATLQELFANGKFKATFLIQRHGESTWIPANELDGLLPEGQRARSTKSQDINLNNWIIGWAVLSGLSILGALSERDWGGLLAAPFGCALLVGICAAIHHARSPCPGCGSRWAPTSWDHERVSGGPDRRFKDNYRRCMTCGTLR
jgi:curved DNA-binding protein CbpA